MVDGVHSVRWSDKSETFISVGVVEGRNIVVLCSVFLLEERVEEVSLGGDVGCCGVGCW